MRALAAFVTTAAAGATAVWSAGCSLALDDLTWTECSDGCELANRAEGLAQGDCGFYECGAEGRCERASHRDYEEIADDRDNDCDHVVDERAPPAFDWQAVGRLPEGSAEGGDSYEPVQTASVAGELHVAIAGVGADADRAAGFAFAGGEIEDGEFRYTNVTTDAKLGCPLLGGASTRACNMHQIALAGVADVLLVAGLNRLGCDKGELRIGIARPPARFDVRLGRPPGAPPDSGPSSIDFGVDVDRGEACSESCRCTGATRPDGVRGAFAPAIAAAEPEDRAAEGLAVWLAADAEAAAAAARECADAQPRRVEALGLRLAGKGDAQFLEASTPERLGETTDLAAPSLGVLAKASDGGGYVLGYGEGESARLQFIPLVTRANSEQVHPPERAFEIRLEDSARVHHTALSIGGPLGPEPGGVARLAFAWRSGCGAEQGLSIALLGFRADEGFVDRSRTALRAPAAVAGPVLAYRSAGFVTAPDRDPEALTGGWLVVWLEQDGAETVARAARIAESDGALLDDPPLALARGRLRAPFVHAGDAAGAWDFQLGFADVEDRKLLVANLSDPEAAMP